MKIDLKRKKARIELIPLLDMIFLVLVSFVYSFLSMTVQKGIPVRLPFAQSSTDHKSEYVVVTVDSDNAIFVNKKRINNSGLKSELLAQKAKNPEVKIYLNADKSVRYNKVIEVLDSIKKTGIEKVSLATSYEDEK